MTVIGAALRRAAVACVLAGPALAQGGTDLCGQVWGLVTENVGTVFPLSGDVLAGHDGWCVVERVLLDLPGSYTPDWQADRVRFRGAALDWIVDGRTLPDALDLQVEGLRLVVRSGAAQMDYLFAAQARANPIQVDLALGWEATTRSLRVDRLEIDFPGDNRIDLTARAIGVDLTTPGAAQMSVTSFAVTEVDLAVQTHGLFEWYLLTALGTMVLPPDGDMQAAEATLKAQAGSAIAALPEGTFSAASKGALTDLVAELPNPSGTLTLAMRSEAGVGPARLMGYAITGVPATLEAMAPLLDGVTMDFGWTHEDAR
jgi:hypothetical protein